MERFHLATDFFLLAHDQFSGKLRISAELLGSGLAGAQIADLLLAERLSVQDGRLVVTDSRGHGADTVDAYVVETIQRQSGTHSVRRWIQTFGEVLYELVARQLIEQGVVRREHGGRQLMRRAPDRFPATDLLVAARPQLRLEHMLRTPHDFDLPGGVMAVLIGALGVESVLDPELDRSQIRDLFEELEKHLPDDFLALVEGVRATGSAVSLRVRR